MTQYLISFGAHAMGHIPDEDAPAVARAARAAVQEAINAGVYVSAGGLETQPASIVVTDGTVTDAPVSGLRAGSPVSGPAPAWSGPRCRGWGCAARRQRRSVIQILIRLF